MTTDAGNHAEMIHYHLTLALPVAEAAIHTAGRETDRPTYGQDVRSALHQIEQLLEKARTDIARCRAALPPEPGPVALDPATVASILGTTPGDVSP